jgi:hypothetical protein
MVTQGVLTVRLVVVALHQAVFLVPTVAVSLVLQAVAVWVVMVVAYLLVVAVAVILAVEEETRPLAADHLILQACWALMATRLLRGRRQALPENRRFSGCLA